MLEKVALFIASLVAALAFAVALVIAGLRPAAVPTATTPAWDPSAEISSPAGAEPQVQVDTIYLPAPVTPSTVTIHRVVRSRGGESEREGSD